MKINHQIYVLIYCILTIGIYPTIKTTKSDSQIFTLSNSKLYSHSNKSSYFGYSLSTFIGQKKPYILIGTPSDIYQDYFTGDNYKTGATYRIGIETNICTEVPTRPKIDEIKAMNSLKWIGGSVSSATGPENGVMLSCDPRFLHEVKPTKSNSKSQLLATGYCSLYTGFSMEPFHINPCSKEGEGSSKEYSQGFCLAGHSSNVAIDSKNITTVALGLPGSYLTEGNIFLGSYGTSKVLNHVLLKKLPGDLNNTGYNLGYAIKMGKLWSGNITKSPFRPEIKNEVVVTSSPYWKPNNHRGIVMVLNLKLDLSQILYIPDTHGHIGSYFGSSLAVGDFNGDKIMDILVSAPYFTRLNVTQSGTKNLQVDIGVVYLFYGYVTHDKKYGVQRGHLKGHKDVKVMYGNTERGYFGQSVELLGDIDADGTDDFAIGCPGCGKDRKGVVYVYLGGNDEPIQIIRAEDIPKKSVLSVCSNDLDNTLTPTQREFKSFGWSLGGNNNDLDSNSVPDLIVGDVFTGQVVLLPSKSLFWFAEPSWTLPRPNVLSWTNNLDSSQPCSGNRCDFFVKLLLKVNGKPKNSATLNQLDLVVTVDLDSEITSNKDKRVQLASAENKTSVFSKVVRLNYRNPKQALEVFAQRLKLKYSMIRNNHWAPIIFKVSIDYKENPNTKPYWLLHPRKGNRTFYSSPKLYFRNPQCGPDNKCISNIKITVRDWSPPYSKFLPGTDIFHRELRTDRHIIVSVTNTGENAYNTRVRIKFPEFFSFKSAHNLQCSMSSPSLLYRTISCLYDNPFPEKVGQEMLNVTFIASDGFESIRNQIRASGSKHLTRELASELNRTLSVKVEASCENEDSDPTNNKVEIKYKLRLAADVEVIPVTPHTLQTDSRNFSLKVNPYEHLFLEKIGPEYRSSFIVKNRGPSPLESVKVTFLLPAYIGKKYPDKLPENFEDAKPDLDDNNFLLYFLKDLNTQNDNGNPITISQLPDTHVNLKPTKADCKIPDQYVNPLQIRVVKKRKERIVKRSTSVSMETKAPSSLSVVSPLVIPDSNVISCANLSSLTTEHPKLGMIHCVPITCSITNLTLRSEVTLNLKAYFWSHTYFQHSLGESILVTKVFVEKGNVSYGLPVDSDQLQIRELSSNHTVIFKGIKNMIGRSIPLWSIIVGILIGLLVLLLIILLLWKCGFFQRNRQFKAEVIDDSLNGAHGPLMTYTTNSTYKPPNNNSSNNNYQYSLNEANNHTFSDSSVNSYH